jgi:hypothetical protein
MILLPYFIEKTENWILVNVFLSNGGRQAWHIESQKDKDILKMLKDNGFPVKTLNKKNGVYYAIIDNSKIDLTSFYSWEEVNPDTSEEDVWRTLTIPVSLWSCPIFRENFCKNANLPLEIHPLLDMV